MARIAHFIPSYRESINPFVADQRSRSMVWAAQNGHEWIEMHRDQLNVDTARNACVEQMRKLEVDYLLMQDADCWATAVDDLEMAGEPLQPLMNVITESGAALVAAPVALRRKERVYNVHPYKPGQVYEAEKVGAGIILIDLKQVNEIAESYDGPWFARTYTDTRQSKLDVGGDVFFSLLLRKYSRSVYVDGRIPTQHAGTTHLTYQPPEGER